MMKHAIRLFALVATLSIATTPSLADPAADAAVDADAGAVADAPTETSAAAEPGWDEAREFYRAIKDGDKRKAAALALIFVTALVRLLLKRGGRFGRWVNESDWGGATVAFGLAFAGGLINALAAQDPFGWGAVSAAFDLGLMAVGGYAVAWKKLLRPLLAKLWGVVAGAALLVLR